MSEFRTLLEELRSKPGTGVAMCVGSMSLTKFAAFLGGYELAMIRRGESAGFLFDFNDWVQARYKTTKKSWDALILADSKNEEDAVAHFWQLLDEFERERNRPVSGTELKTSDLPTPHPTVPGRV